MERKLASIQEIRNILPIEGADMIEVAEINNWRVIVAKNEDYQIGDKVIYCEIDSFLPIKDEYEFLRKSSYKKMEERDGFRIKTMKLRGEISQGLVLPLFRLESPENYNIDDDVTEELGIIKYEAPIPSELSGTMKGNFPSFLIKTDESRVQNLTRYYNDYKSEKFFVTEKLDGTSATFYLKDGEFGVCSRNLEFKPMSEQESNPVYWRMAIKYNIEENLRKLGRNICIQGEIIGDGIQNNNYKLTNQCLKVFNVFDIDKYEYFVYNDFVEMCNQLELETVPIISENFILPDKISDLILMADGKSALNKDRNREGLVVRAMNKRISFKVISNRYLLKNEQ